MAKSKTEYVLTLDEGEFTIYWDEFIVGSSFFIPCTDLMGAKTKINRHAGNCGYKVKSYTVIEQGMLGVRVWRTA